MVVSVDLAGLRKEDPGQVPIRFEIPYDPAKIDERHTDAARARILRGDTLGFTTDKVYWANWCNFIR